MIDMKRTQKQNQRLLAAFRFWRAAAFVTMGVSIVCIGATSACVGRLTAEIKEGQKMYAEHLELDRLKEQEAEQEKASSLRVAVVECPDETIETLAGGHVEPEYEYLGEFTVTAYCPCEKCCGQWADGVTASGVMATPGIVAVDKKIIPLGSKIVIGEDEYLAADTGGAIKGNRIDIFMDSHDSALDFGIQNMQVWMVEEAS